MERRTIRITESGVTWVVNSKLLGGVSAGISRIGKPIDDDPLGLKELGASITDWYGEGSGSESVSFEEAAAREHQMKDWHDDAVTTENLYPTDVPRRDSRPPCKAAGLND